MAPPTITKPTFEHHPNGFGIGCSAPRISWRFVASDDMATGWAQTGYEIETAISDKTYYDLIRGDQSVLVPWPARTLQSREAATVRVRSIGKGEGEKDDTNTAWSAPATVEAALLQRKDWKASFIAAPKELTPDGSQPPVRFRKTFTFPEGSGIPEKARLYITSFGVFDAYIDGVLISDEHMAPGWTSYRHRLNYRILDVTSHLTQYDGLHAICVEVGAGWFASRIGLRGGKKFTYGDDIGVLVQLEVYFGSSQERWTLTSGEDWTWGRSAIQASQIYEGEVYDMNKEVADWNIVSSVADSTFSTGVKALPWPGAKLIASESPPVRLTEKKHPVKIFKSDSGKTVVDFGQNLVGKVLVKRLSLPADAQACFTHAEVMEHGELGTRPLRSATARDIIISSGKSLMNWTPRFTFHGFRYVQVDGWEPSADDIVALVLHSDMTRTGHFSCSNPYVNQLYSNIVWSTRGNFLSIPTDCPQRDERLGWTGDIQAFSTSASFIFNTIGFLSSWLEDLMAEQLEEGRRGIPPLVIPEVHTGVWDDMPAAIWDDVTVITPRDLHRFSGDLSILERQLPSMLAWLEHGVDRGSDGLWSPSRWQLGDWLDPSAPPEDPGAAKTNSVMVADAYLVHVTESFSVICSLLSRSELTLRYSREAAKLKSIFQEKYITPYGNLVSGTQTGISLAVMFDLYPRSQHLEVAAAELDKLVRSAGFHISTGFAGTPVICHALTSTFQPHLAYRMLLEKTCPSWLYPITMGATTVWERWDSMLPDGTINPGQMTSFNHYALGAVADWIHRTVGGISPAESGWKIVRVRPVPGGNLTEASVSFDGPYGLISCKWSISGNKFKMRLHIPPNSTAIVTLPSELKKSAGGAEEKTSLIASGEHDFECDWQPVDWPPQPIVAPNIKPREMQIAA